MTHAKLSPHSYIIRLERGEDILKSVQEFCAATGIANGSLSGIGSAENLKLAHYSIDTQNFTHRSFEGIHEITSLLGNVALLNDQPLVHAHVTISGPDMITFGGHLAAGTCSATLELVLSAYPSAHTKAHDDLIGLNVWQLPRSQT